MENQLLQWLSNEQGERRPQTDQGREIEWVDLRFTDPKGKWQHLTMCASAMDEDALEDGLMFDGSSIEGWKAINESDMILRPDLDPHLCRSVQRHSDAGAVLRHRRALGPATLDYGRDPRSTAKRAEAFLVDRHWRHDLCRSGARVLHVRRCTL